MCHLVVVAGSSRLSFNLGKSAHQPDMSTIMLVTSARKKGKSLINGSETARPVERNDEEPM